MEYIEKVNGSIQITKAAAPAFEDQYDVAIVGLGTAGAISAIVSAKNNFKTLGVERFNMPGGTMTMGGVQGYYFGNTGGYYEQVDAIADSKKDMVINNNPHHPDLASFVLERQFEAFGVTALYDSIITGLYADGRKITGIEVFDGQTLRNFGVKVLIDATGDGDLCDIAGCSMDFGRQQDGSTVPLTISECGIQNGYVARVNSDTGKVDQRDPVALSQAVLTGQALYTTQKPGRKVIRIHPQPGIREGRLLNGEKKLTAADYLNGKREAEPVIYAYADLDKHGIDSAFDSETFRKWDILANLGALNISVPVPKECLIAKEFDNLAVAGRNLSVDHEMLTCIRMNRDMRKLGEVSAILAIVAIADNVPLKDVQYERLLPYLQKYGCLREDNNRGFWFDGGKHMVDYIRQAHWLDSPEEINKQLSTLCPGIAIWSCKLLGDSIKPVLTENLASADELLRKHSAIALAVLEDPAAIPVLREMVVSRDRTFLKDMRKNNKSHIAMALCALGILKDSGSMELIRDLVADPQEAKGYETINGINWGYYGTLSNAVAALMYIADAHPAQKPNTAAFLEQELSSLAYIRRITQETGCDPAYVLSKDIYNNVQIWANR